ncbi:MAG: beta-lactamase family protein [Myxococcales bacterium]|nr:beta-lactamase family protein [Myxococcales bacterium]
MSSRTEGECKEDFEEVRRVFDGSFEARRELGASLCVWHRGEMVIDLWGGYVDKARTQKWERDTMCTIFSTTKGMVALCFLMLADRGNFDYDEPVAKYWPEFAANGKETIRIRTLLNHRSGLVAIDEPIDLDDFANNPEKVARIAAQQTPYWEPDTDQGYHGVTYGIYAAELFRRIAGESIGRFLSREVASPLAADVHIGLPASEEGRVSPSHPAGLVEFFFKIVPKLLFHTGNEGRVYRQIALGKEAARAFANPAEVSFKGVKNFNTSRVHAMELPWSNGIANARGLARVYAALASEGSIDGHRLVSAEAIAPLHETQSWTSQDRVLRKPQGWTQGFIKEIGQVFSPNKESFGHPGAGGALGWCDPIEELAISYIPNKMAHHIRSPRARALTAAVYRCLGL